VIKLAKYDQKGRYYWKGVGSDDTPDLNEPNVYVGDVDPETQYHDFATDQPVDIPPRPGPQFQFDYETKTWIDPRTLGELKTTLTAQIEVELQGRVDEPILEVNGVRLNADATSKQRLREKLVALQARTSRGKPPPAEDLVWRDADNTVRTFANLKQYRDFLEDFAVAIDERDAAARRWAWNKKATLEALTTREQVLSFDAKA